MTGIYSEDGGRWRVEVLEDAVNDEGFRVVKMRCLEELLASPLMGKIEPGEEWSSSVKVGYEGFVDWRLQLE